MSHLHASEALLAFWFGAAGDDVEVAQRQGRIWWGKDPELDRRIAAAFADELPATAGTAADWPETPRARLARIILFDQVPRNIYRGQPQAFAWDALARREAEAALAAGDETGLSRIERVFLYLPFEHAEDLRLQDRSVERFAALRAEAPSPARPTFDGFLDFARRHRDIIRRFGRFPHRNVILGRTSTSAEEEFLKQPGSGF